MSLPPPLSGQSVRDERQLDGARHLTLDLADATRDWSATVHLVLDRDGAPREGEIDIEGPGGIWSGAITGGEAVESEGQLHLRARFLGDDPEDPERLIDLREDMEGEGFRLSVV